MTSIRNLCVLDINDQPSDEFASGQGNARYFTVQHITSWQSLQTLLRDGGQLSPDLILTDVSFDRDESVLLAEIPGTTDPQTIVKKPIVPVGPFLALCFLQSRPVVSFGVYSGHMKAESLLSYPPFLVAMGLLAAKAEGQVFSSRHLSKRVQGSDLDLYITKLSSYVESTDVLGVALRAYRRNLAAKLKVSERLDDGHFRILNAWQLSQWLRPYQEPFETDGKVADPIAIPEDKHLWIWGGGIEDRISLRSLFADLMEWSTDYIHKVGIPAFLDWFKAIGNPDPCWSCAVFAMKKRMQPGRTKWSIADLIAEEYSELPTETLHEVFRLCVLFGNIEAWLKEKDAQAQYPARNNVFKALGIHEQVVYQGWFNERKSNSRSKSLDAEPASGPGAKLVSPLKVRPLPVFNPNLPVGAVGRCFVERGTVLSEQDDRRVEQYCKLVEKSWHAQHGKPYNIAQTQASGV